MRRRRRGGRRRVRKLPDHDIKEIRGGIRRIDVERQSSLLAFFANIGLLLVHTVRERRYIAEGE